MRFAKDNRLMIIGVEDKYLFSIHVIRCRDLETIDSFFDELEKTYPNFKHWLQYTCEDRFCLCCVDKYENLIGLTILADKPYRYTIGIDSENICKICTLYILEEYRRKGIGSHLLKCIIDYKSNIECFYTKYKKENKSMDNFLKKYKFSTNTIKAENDDESVGIICASELRNNINFILNNISK